MKINLGLYSLPSKWGIVFPHFKKRRENKPREDKGEGIKPCFIKPKILSLHVRGLNDGFVLGIYYVNGRWISFVCRKQS